MKQAVISDKTRIPAGLAIIAIGGGAFWLSAVFSQLQENTRAIQEMHAEVRALASIRTDIEVIKSKVQGLERPVMHTRRDVKAIRKEVAQLNSGPIVPFYTGPITMRGR